MRGAALEFVSAFSESRAFFWLTISSLLGSVGSLIDGSFRMYWYQDVLAPLGFNVFGYELTHSFISIISIMGLVTSLIRTLTSLFGGYLGARYGPRVLLLAGGILNAPNPFIFAATSAMGKHAFTVVFCLAIVDAIYGGLTVGPSGAFMADCLPAGEDGQPRNAARDIQLFSLAGSIPGLVLPVATGAAFKLFSSEAAAFRMFYLVGGSLSLLTLPLILLINPYKERNFGVDFGVRRGRALELWNKEAQQRGATPRVVAARAPPQPVAVGARVCDWLLFGVVARTPSHQPQRQEDGGGGVGRWRGVVITEDKRDDAWIA